jgi:hypothetical protein
MPSYITDQAQKDAYNEYWLGNAYTRGDSIWMVTDPDKFAQTLQNANKSPNVSAYFRVEIPMLNTLNNVNAVPAYILSGPPTIISH